MLKAVNLSTIFCCLLKLERFTHWFSFTLPNALASEKYGTNCVFNYFCLVFHLILHFELFKPDMLQDLRKHWLSILMIVTSSRSSINIKHLEKATVSTGKEGLVSEGNAAYNWSR